MEKENFNPNYRDEMFQLVASKLSDVPQREIISKEFLSVYKALKEDERQTIDVANKDSKHILDIVQKH